MADAERQKRCDMGTVFIVIGYLQGVLECNTSNGADRPRLILTYAVLIKDLTHGYVVERKPDQKS